MKNLNRSLLQFLSFLFLLVFFVSPFPAFSQTENNPDPLPPPAYRPRMVFVHSPGDQAFSLSAGLFIPLFFENPSGDGEPHYTNTNLSLGGVGTLAWDYYFTNNYRLGAEFGGNFSYDPNSLSMFMIPVLINNTWEFHISQLFSIPLGLGIGINFTTYNDLFQFNFALKPSVGFLWHYTADWSFGVLYNYWWILETPGGDPMRLGNFSDVSLTVRYHVH